MQLPGEGPIFKENRRPLISTTAVVLLALIVIGAIFASNTTKYGGSIEPLFLPTPTSTRSAFSYLEEGQAYFLTGNLNAAISAYEDALAVDPNNVPVLTELARIQVYSSALLTPEDQRLRLLEALENINLAVEVDDTSSDAHAVRTLTLDWLSSVATSVEERESYLAEASQAAVRAVQLDNQNALAIAYRAEVLADQLQFTQARQLAELALSLEPNLMDTHRIYAYILEATGNYSKAIEEYRIAASIMPNLTFLYISIGQNYRQLQLYDQALEYFDRAASINELLGIQDPLPYIAISKTYSRQGEFFIAARNMQRALDFNPTNPDVYGQLGVVYFRSRNYEGSIPVLQCAVEGCTAEENEEQEVAVTGLSLNNASVVYYYTYGSVLASLDQCDKAVDILNQVQELYFNDEVIMSIVQDGLIVCELLGGNDSAPPPAAATPTPEQMEEDMGEEGP